MKKNLNQWKKPLLVLLFLIVAIVMVPKLFSGYKLKVINISLIYSLLVLSLTIILGMGGQMSFAAIPFMGLGAYTVANFCSGRLGFYLNPVVALLVAIVGVGIFGFLLGLILMKLKGVFFTFSTIAFAQVALSFFSQYRPLFGGPDGINKIETLYIGRLWFDTPVKWFYLMLALVVVAALIVERIRATKFGRSLACIRDNNTAALTLGVDTYMTRVYAFTCQAVIAALAGGIYALLSGYVGSDMFAYNRATLMVIMVMLGGINSTLGCIAGAFIVNILPELLRAAKAYLNLSFGLLVILFMIFMPDGVSGLIGRIPMLLHKKTENENAAAKEAEKG